MTDYFVSYTSSDEEWAEWVAWILDEAGFAVLLQKWDFVAGSNFVLEMQRAAVEAKRTIAIFSPEYLTRSRFGAAEWAAAFAKDSDGLTRVLVPVLVRPCAAEGLLKSIVHIDLVGLDEDTARRKLLDELAGARRKPTTKPSYPGAFPSRETPHPFPGRNASSRDRIPKIRSPATDLERRRFIKDTFYLIYERFERWLGELVVVNPGVDVDLVRVDATKFTAEVFVNGHSRAFCKIWLGGLFGGEDDIAYAEGRRYVPGDNSLNEALTIADGAGELSLRAMMNMGIGKAAEGLDPESMSSEDGAYYLWRRFLWRFEQ